MKLKRQQTANRTSTEDLNDYFGHLNHGFVSHIYKYISPDVFDKQLYQIQLKTDRGNMNANTLAGTKTTTKTMKYE